MGYQHGPIKTVCPKCGTIWFWKRRDWGRQPDRLYIKCNCGADLKTKSVDAGPPVPPTLYIGQDNSLVLKLYPVPPEVKPEQAARSMGIQPYSIRSFTYQASRFFGGCLYESERRGDVWGEPVFMDQCGDLDGPWMPDPTARHDCHMVGGWTKGKATCPLWEKLMALCQTDRELHFLHKYLSLAKDRHFPMLIPQVRIGIGERRRPDFVVFVPVHYWKYNWYAIQLDGGHPEERAAEDKIRDADIAANGYTVLPPFKSSNLFEEVRRLIERVDQEMALAETNPEEVAVEVEAEIREEEAERDVRF